MSLGAGSKSKKGTSDKIAKAPETKPSEVDDDSGVSVSGNISQSSSSSSGSGSEADGVTTDAVDGLKTSKNTEDEVTRLALMEVQCRAEKLAEYIISQTLSPKSKPADKVEETLLRCVKSMTSKHEILFNGMMRRLRINEETAYSAFITVANELFEGDKLIVNWGRIVALYAFGGQLALYCKEKDLTVCGERIPIYVGRYAKEVVSTFVHKEGGWNKVSEKFPPEDDMDNKVWRLLTWTAVGLGLATAVSFFTSHT